MGQSCVILLDTHVVVWLAFEADRISKKARMAIGEARARAEPLAVSCISLLELATLATKGRLNINITIESFLHEVESRFVIMPIKAEACARSLSLPADYPKDPADRIIGATALVEGLPLLTADRNIRQTNAVKTIW